MDLGEIGLWLFGIPFLALWSIPFGVLAFYLYELFFGEDKIRRKRNEIST